MKLEKNFNYLFHNENCEEIENQFKARFKRKIHLDPPPKSIDEIISRMMLGEITYCSTRVNRRTQCTQNRGRSIQDIYSTCLTYFPQTKLEVVMKILKQVNNVYSGYFYCSTIGKYRMGQYHYLTQLQNKTRLNNFKKTITNAINTTISGGIPEESN